MKMKKTLQVVAAVISLTALTGLAQAATPGTYLGGGLGYSKLNTPDQNLVTGPGAAGLSQSHDRNGLGEKAFVGYNFNQYFGIEGGYAHFAQSKYSTSLAGVGSAKLDYYSQNINLVGKAYLPIYDTGFNVYALGGAAYVRSEVEGSVNTIVGADHGSKTTNKLRPTYGVGATYDIPCSKFTTGVELSRVQGIGNVRNSDSAIPNADMAAFTISYNIG